MILKNVVGLRSLNHIALITNTPDDKGARFTLNVLITTVEQCNSKGTIVAISNERVTSILNSQTVHRLSTISRTQPIAALPTITFHLLATIESDRNRPLPGLLGNTRRSIVVHGMLTSRIRRERRNSSYTAYSLLHACFTISR